MAAAIRNDLARLTGATTPEVRAVRRQYSKLLAHEPPEFILAVVKTLLTDETWPARVVAFELLAEHRAAMSRVSAPMVEEMAGGLADWGSIDLFGVTVAGPAWRERRVTDGQVRRWARSPDCWRRRLALVATVPLNIKSRGGTGDGNRTLAICRLLLDDRDDMVVKALSWALRELAKRDAQCVTDFLRKEDARLASRVRREVRTKLETGLKNKRRNKR